MDSVLARRQKSASDRLKQYEVDKKHVEEKPYIPAVGEWLVVDKGSDGRGTGWHNKRMDPKAMLRSSVQTTVVLSST